MMFKENQGKEVVSIIWPLEGSSRQYWQFGQGWFQFAVEVQGPALHIAT